MTLIVFLLHIKECVRREGFNHSYAIKKNQQKKSKIMMKKSLFYQNQHLKISHIRAKLFFNDPTMCFIRFKNCVQTFYQHRLSRHLLKLY